MRKASLLHAQAMAAATRADDIKSKGEYDLATREYAVAYALEREAALLFVRKYDLEPTRSVLFRSAASLAIDCELYREAEELIGHGLSGNPPPELRVELRELYEQAHFQLFLKDSHLELKEGQIVVSLWGEQIAPGFVSCKEVIRRMSKTERLIYRTAERKLGMAYTEDSQPSEEVTKNFKVFASIPIAASYAVVLRVAERERQLAFDFAVDAAAVVSELLECMELYNKDEPTLLESRIPDPAYRRNFVNLAHQLYPDSDDVSHVGIAGVGAGGQLRIVDLWKPPTMKISRNVLDEGSMPEAPIFRKISGTLFFANSSTRSRSIKIEDDQRQSHKIDVPEGMMADVVRPFFEERVVAEVRVQPDKSLLLESILAG